MIKNFLYVLLISLLLTLISSPRISLQQIDWDTLQAEQKLSDGVRAYHRGFYNESILSCLTSISFRPDVILTRQWLARANYKSGFVEEALREWESIIQSGQGDSMLENWVNLLRLRRGLGEELREKGKFVYLTEINSQQTGFYPYEKPTSVKITDDGTIYLVAWASHEILKLSSNHTVMQVIKGGLPGFDFPFDILITEEALYVTEYWGDRVAICTLSGEKKATFGKKGRNEGELIGPQYLAADGKGYLYVTDWGNKRISKFDLSGNFILSFSREGIQPTGIAVHNERVYIADRNGKGVAVFDLSGNFIQYLVAGLLENPEGMTLNNSGALLITDGSRIVELDVYDEVVEIIADVSSHSKGLTSVAVSPNGEIYTTDFNLNSVFVLSSGFSLYTGYSVFVERIDASDFPIVQVEFTVKNPLGDVLVGLDDGNFILSENQVPINNKTIISRNTDPYLMDVVVLVDKSNLMSPHQDEVGRAMEELIDSLGASGRIKVVSAHEEPVEESVFGDTRLRHTQAVDPVGHALERPVDRQQDFAVDFLVVHHHPDRSRAKRLLGDRGFEQGVIRFDQAERRSGLLHGVIEFHPKGRLSLDGIEQRRDLFVLQPASDALDQAVQFGLNRFVLVDAERDIHPADQIQPQRDGVLAQPLGFLIPLGEFGAGGVGGLMAQVQVIAGRRDCKHDREQSHENDDADA